jgi:hypothetical protein
VRQQGKRLQVVTEESGSGGEEDGGEGGVSDVSGLACTATGVLTSQAHGWPASWPASAQPPDGEDKVQVSAATPLRWLMRAGWSMATADMGHCSYRHRVRRATLSFASFLLCADWYAGLAERSAPSATSSIRPTTTSLAGKCVALLFHFRLLIAHACADSKSGAC